MVVFVWAASDDSAIEAIGYATEYSLIWVIVGMIVATGITMNRKNTSFSVWYMITWISYSRMLGLINTELDSSTLDFMGKLSKGLNGIQIISHYERKSANSRFSELGFESNHFFNNTEKFLIGFFGSIACYILMIIFGFCYKTVHDFKEATQVNLFTRALIVCCFDFSLFGFLQVYHISLSTTYDTLCSIFGVMIIALCVVSLIYLPISIKGKTMISDSEVHESTLLFEFKYKEAYNCYYYLMFMITRIISSIFLVFADELPEIQVSAISLCTIINLTFLIKYRPYREELVNYLVIACEVCQLLMVVAIACFLTDISSSSSYLLRWLIIISFWLGIIFCFLRFLYHMLKKPSQPHIIPQEPVQDQIIKNKRENSQTDLMSIDQSKLSDQARINQLDKMQNLKKPGQNDSRPGVYLTPSFRPHQESRQSDKFSAVSGKSGLNSKLSARPNLNSIVKVKNGKEGLPVIEDLEGNEDLERTNLEIRHTPQHIKTPSNHSPASSQKPAEIENHYSGISYYPKLAQKYLNKNHK